MKTATQISLCLALALTASTAFAAISKKEVKPRAEVVSSKTVLLQATREALALPLSNRIEALIDQGPQGYRNLVELMFSESMPMETRWRAVMAAGLIGREHSRPELERALKSNDWFMRNAGLQAMAAVDRPETMRWAKKLISDKALVVRTMAVSSMQDLNDISSVPLLWQKLYAKENFRGKQSLFIRRRIVEALSALEAPGREAKFIQVLADKDEMLHGPAIVALERLTQSPLGQSKDSVAMKREQWQEWWKTQGTKSAKM